MKGTSMTTETTNETITEQVRQRYADAAQAVQTGSGCCDSSCCSSPGDDAVTRDLYTRDETEALPE
jgi:hypothetical protein